MHVAPERTGGAAGLGSSGRRALRLVLVALTGAVVALATASPAHAHAEFTGSVPADGAQLAEPPPEIRLAFSGDMRGNTARVVLTVGSDEPRELPVGFEDDQIVVAVPAAVTAAPRATPWQLAYRLVSGDGHAVMGAVAFTVAAAPAASTPSPAPASPDAAVPLVTSSPDEPALERVGAVSDVERSGLVLPAVGAVAGGGLVLLVLALARGRAPE